MLAKSAKKFTKTVLDMLHGQQIVQGDTVEEFWALKDVSFKINSGDVVGIVGRNGAGKSTLLKVLSRITEPTKGRVSIRGRVASLLEVGTGFHPELTGRENIFLNGSILGMSRSEIKLKFDEMVQFAEVEKFLDTPVKRYSSGMYVRLAFSVAAHLEPEILVVDEVLAVGDASFQKKCIGKMQDVAKGGRTVLFVSHNMAAVQSLCSSGMYLKNGSLALFGAIEEVMDAYHSEGHASRESRIEFPKCSSGVASIFSVQSTVDGARTCMVPLNRPLDITMEYDVEREGVLINASVHLNDQFGNCIFASGNLKSAIIEQDILGEEPHAVARYRTRCTIPGELINDVGYSISVFLVTDRSNIIDEHRECLQFYGIDDGSMRKEYTGHWAGVIRPKLSWKTVRLEGEK